MVRRLPAEIGEDASALFNLLTGYSQGHAWKRLVVAPMDLADRLAAEAAIPGSSAALRHVACCPVLGSTAQAVAARSQRQSCARLASGRLWREAQAPSRAGSERER